MWKWRYNVFVTWPRNRSVIWLYAWWPLNLSTRSTEFGGYGPCGWGNMTFLNCHVTTGSACYVNFWVGPVILSQTPCQVLGTMGFVNVWIWRLWFVTWPPSWYVTWLCAWSPLILTHHPAKFEVHRPYGSGDNDVCNISSNSSSNSYPNAKVPMPMFTNGQFN